jgi:ribulose 1,5-bisphosphate synthetase/thiazole synthase
MSSSNLGKYDAILIGAGHNCLVTASYLAMAGLKVMVLDKRPIEKRPTAVLTQTASS